MAGDGPYRQLAELQFGDSDERNGRLKCGRRPPSSASPPTRKRCRRDGDQAEHDSRRQERPSRGAADYPDAHATSRKRTIDEDDQRPLDFRLIARLFEYTRPYASTRNWLLVVGHRPLDPAAGPDLGHRGRDQRADSAPRSGRRGVGSDRVYRLGDLHAVGHALIGSDYALELGESVVRDLRIALFQHLQRMPMSFFHRTKIGRIISRMTSDIEDVRVGVQEVLFVSLVQVGQMAVAAVFMLWYDSFLFLIVLGLAPALVGHQPFLPSRIEPLVAGDARFVQPRDGDAGRIGPRRPRHAGISSGRMKTPGCSASWRPIIRATTTPSCGPTACSCRCSI